MFSSTALLGALAGTAMAGTVIWDGRFNNMTSSTDLDNWSFSNPVGQYQYYIHGTGNVTEYVNLDPTYKNPADTSSNKGVKITLDQNAVWNNDGMLRTELIPQTSAPINKGKVYYHFSMQHTGVNPPSQGEEHQVCFFESHFTEMKYGLISGEQGTADNQLRWEVGSTSKWNVSYEAGVWHNIAYAIDFDAQTVGFWHSTGADDLTLTAGPFSASTSSNGADWHLGVLRLASSTGASDTAPEDWYFSGVYVESGDLTTSVSGPGGAAPAAAAPASSSVSSAAASVTSVAAAASASTSSLPALSATPYNPIATASASSSVAASATTLQTSVRSSSSVAAPASSSVASSAASSSASSTVVIYSTATVQPVASSSSSSVAAPASSSLPAYTPSAYTPPAITTTTTPAPVTSSSNGAATSPASTQLSAYDQSSATTALATNYLTASAISASSASSASVASAYSSSASAASASASAYSSSTAAAASLSSSAAAASGSCVVEYVYV